MTLILRLLCRKLWIGSELSGSRSDPQEKPDPDPTLMKNRIQIRSSRKIGSRSDPHEKPDSVPTLIKQPDSNLIKIRISNRNAANMYINYTQKCTYSLYLYGCSILSALPSPPPPPHFNKAFLHCQKNTSFRTC